MSERKSLPPLMEFGYALMHALRPFGFGTVRVDMTWRTSRSEWCGEWAEAWAVIKTDDYLGKPRKRVWALRPLR